MRFSCAVLALAVSVAAAHERVPSAQLLQRGIAFSREAAYAASVAALEQARVDGALDAAQTIECAFYLATDYVALGSTAAARRELRAVIERAPGYELPAFTSPKVAALFREVHDEAERSLHLRALVPRRRSAPERVELWFEPARAGGAAYGAVYWRWRGEGAFREEPLGHGGENLVARVPVDRAGTLEYFAESRSPSGAAQVGTREHPLELPVTAPQVRQIAAAPVARPSLARKWWLWTTLGAVTAAGVGVGLYFALRPTPPSTADAVLDFGLR